LGVSDRWHFEWLTEALGRFEAEQGALGALRREGRPLDLWCFAGQRLDPPLAWLRDTLGAERTRVAFFDKFAGVPGVRAHDLNDLGALPAASCDVFTLLRASMFVEDPGRFLAGLRRLLRPGGLAVIDWLHGLSDAPVLDLRGDPRYGGGPTPYRTTYCDPRFLQEFPQDFAAFLRHVNRPPAWANLERPGRPVPWGERLSRWAGGGPRRAVTPETYLETLRAELERAGKHLIEPGLMEQHFKVAFRHARYLYPMVRKFNLYLLTVLEPVGA
jgi:SAM-dependent methyltransferase